MWKYAVIVKIIQVLAVMSFNVTAENVVVMSDVSYTETGATYLKSGITEFKLYTTDEDITFTTNGKEYTVPAGYHTDLATIPHYFWDIVAPTDIATAGIIHDFIYEEIVSNGSDEFTIDQADGIFKSIIADETNAFLANAIVVSLRILVIFFPGSLEGETY